MKKQNDYVNKNELAEILAEKTNVEYSTALAIVEETFETIMELMADKKMVRIVGFGEFDVIEKKERIGINPGTKEKIMIPPSVSPTFRAGSNMKKIVKGYNHMDDYHVNVVIAQEKQEQENKINTK